MLEDFFIEFLKLKNARETFATAMVVQHGTPISGKPVTRPSFVQMEVFMAGLEEVALIR